ncbi:MAG: hypothetical protein Tsb0013_13090 [Phycisphaerales bacterium]
MPDPDITVTRATDQHGLLARELELAAELSPAGCDRDLEHGALQRPAPGGEWWSVGRIRSFDYTRLIGVHKA